MHGKAIGSQSTREPAFTMKRGGREATQETSTKAKPNKKHAVIKQNFYIQ